MSPAAVTTPDHVRITVHDLGGAGGTPLVMAHGAGLHGLVWSPVATKLRSVFHCLSFDARGHGDSRGPRRGRVDWHAFGTDVLAVVDGLGLSRPFGAGHSLGATALLLAEQARPGTFGGLYCFEPVVPAADPPLGRDPDSWLAAAARRRRDAFVSRDEAQLHFRSRPPFASVAPEALSAYLQHGLEEHPDGSVRLKCRPDDEAAVYEMATAHDCFVNLDRVHCPVAIAWGGHTERYRERAAAPIAARLAQPCFEMVPGVGHLGPLESPEMVAASVRAFFDPDTGSRECSTDIVSDRTRQMTGGLDGCRRGT